MDAAIALPCRTPLTAPALADHEAEALAATMRALADPNRIRILHRLASAAPAGVCVCDLTDPLGIAQPSVSHHLAVLRRAGLVERRREASFAYYSLVPGVLDRLAALFRGAA